MGTSTVKGVGPIVKKSRKTITPTSTLLFLGHEALEELKTVSHRELNSTARSSGKKIK